MTIRTVPILAAVTTNERLVVEAAAAQLGRALSQAAGEAWGCPCTFVPGFAELATASPGSLVVTSLLVPLAQLEVPWAEVEQDLRSSYAALCATGDPVMICTIVRHVEAAGDPDHADRVRRRLRQLNLLATELSREYGALVIDLDRVIADIGARRLETDYRLAGPAAAEIAGNAVALCIAINALDAFAPVDVQDRARAVLESTRPSVGLASEIQLTNLVALGHGRRKQRVSTVINEVQENHVGWLVGQVLKGRIGGREAFDRLAQALRRRGARESMSLLIAGVARLFKQAA